MDSSKKQYVIFKFGSRSKDTNKKSSDIFFNTDDQLIWVDDISFGGKQQHSHTNKSVLDGITQSDIDNWNGGGSVAAQAHTHANKSILDGITNTSVNLWNDSVKTVTTSITGNNLTVKVNNITSTAIAIPTGPQGDMGAQGFQGAQGPQGNQGPQGTQGRQGAQGNQGTQGFQGVQGPQGRQGAQGNQGDRGYQGYQGYQGTQGPQGPAATGSSFSIGNIWGGSGTGVVIGQNSSTLQISGATCTTAGVMTADSYYANSDERLKENISPITIDDLIVPVEFDWKETKRHSYGFIAQELQKLGYSELINTDDSGYLKVNYDAAYGLAIACLCNKVKKLENEIEYLKSLMHN